MNTTHKFVRTAVTLIGIFSILFSSLQIQPTVAAAQGTDDGIQRDYNSETGKVTHITGTGNEPITVMGAMSADMTSTERGDVLVERFAPEFGLSEPSEELVVADESQPEADRIVTKYQQVYQGVPVLGGELIVNASDKGELYSMNGEVSQGLALNTTPAISVETAIDIAKQGMTKWYGGAKADYQHTNAALFIFDESLLRPSFRPVELVWKIEMTTIAEGQPIRELVMVSAKTGNIPLHFNQIDTMWENVQAEPIVQYDDPAPTETATPIPTETPIPMDTPLPTETVQPDEAVVGIQSASDVPAFSGAIWYVSTTGSDVNSCSLPSLPCLTIQKAIDKAMDGDRIAVAAGIYGNTSIMKDIFLSGGWNTDFTVQNDMSVIDGKNFYKDLSIGGMQVTVERFIVQNGNGVYGGGIEFYNGGNLTLNNVMITANYATEGAGIYSLSGTITLNNSTVSNNRVGGHGDWHL
ncbi:MAG: hypothetical protein QM730_21245 [Anaerolineales bacterium]